MKRTIKKLSLYRDTIYLLSADDLKQPVGGSLNPCSDPCQTEICTRRTNCCL